MKNGPAPRTASPGVSLFAARNEYEPFLLVLKPNQRLDRVRVDCGPLAGPDGVVIDPSRISVCHVGSVNVTVPTDEAGAAGEWPDPLPPYEGPFTAWPGENQPLWITVFVPADAPAGDYAGRIFLSAGAWKFEVPVSLKVWGFTLPRESHVRSSFGTSTGFMRLYHNLETKEELEQVADLYYRNLRDHRVAPRDPMELYPMKVSVKGVGWRGGEFTGELPHSGKRAVKAADDSISADVEVIYENRIPVTPGTPYRMTWWARTAAAGQKYTALIQGYNAEGVWEPAWNRLSLADGSLKWKSDSIEVAGFAPETRSVSVHFFPVFRDGRGSATGTAFFDDVSFGPAAGGGNLLSGGDMEMDPAGMSVEVDWTEFDRGARRYLDELGFNAFDLRLEGLGAGSFYSREKGIFAGFRQGTPAYDSLMSRYLGQVEKHLEENRWLGKEYIYWFDEPDPKDYPFVREGMLNIRKAAPRLTRFITEHRPGPDIMDVSEVSCTIFHRVDPKIVAELGAKGREFWSYLCTGPKAPWVTLFIDHPAVNLRLWPWMSYRFGLKGILVWEAMYWTSHNVYPEGRPQNPWTDPMSYTSGYGTPYGEIRYWGNGDGRFIYPPNRNVGVDKAKYLGGPVNSVRWEILREGLEDYEYLWLLERAVRDAPDGEKPLAAGACELLDVPAAMFVSGQEYTKDPRVILEHRRKIALALEALAKAR
ncbi:MAG: hypothetical protein A2W03_09470 [Candidatus Aminicenantes bacterium RBG_16_63_16]|nr:MAG: hypothetical protein A2W03_09470 [Candidatus Aminicenantes bacterium RBG_16_63_16]